MLDLLFAKRWTLPDYEFMSSILLSLLEPFLMYFISYFLILWDSFWVFIKLMIRHKVFKIFCVITGGYWLTVQTQLDSYTGWLRSYKHQRILGRRSISLAILLLAWVPAWKCGVGIITELSTGNVYDMLQLWNLYFYLCLFMYFL